MARARASLLQSGLCLLLLQVLGPAPAAAQLDPYESRYGTLIDVSLDDLLQMPESYVGKPVRTRGPLDMVLGLRPMFALRGTFGGRLLITATSEAAADWENLAPRWVGREVEVSGLVGITGQGTTTQAELESVAGARSAYIVIFAFLGPPDENEAKVPAVEVKLEDLVTRPGPLDGKRVAVSGQFRGANLFGDLPAASRRRTSDWVIKDELFAVWVTGRKPRGDGFTFDPELKRDTGKWLRVSGRVAVARGVVTIEATSVSLAKPPSPTAQAQPPAPPPPRPRQPPVVVFSLPVDGERDVPPGTVFRVQFSQDIDEASLKGRVLLRYAGRPQPGDRELDAVKVRYELGPHAVEIDPGDLLRPGRVVEVVLLPGIVDLDGQPLQTRPGFRPGDGVVDVLRFRIAEPGFAASSP